MDQRHELTTWPLIHWVRNQKKLTAPHRTYWGLPKSQGTFFGGPTIGIGTLGAYSGIPLPGKLPTLFISMISGFDDGVSSSFSHATAERSVYAMLLAHHTQRIHGRLFATWQLHQQQCTPSTLKARTRKRGLGGLGNSQLLATCLPSFRCMRGRPRLSPSPTLACSSLGLDIKMSKLCFNSDPEILSP